MSTAPAPPPVAQPSAVPSRSTESGPRSHRQRRPGWPRRRRTPALLLSVLGLVGASLVGAGLVAAGPRSAAEHYYADDPTELALARAVASGDTDRIARLVADGADADAVGTDDITMLEWAIEARSPAGVRALLDAGALRDRLGRAGRAPLHDAARSTDPRYVQLLLAAGADPDVRVAQTQTTPLREACLSTAPATLEALLAGGADVDATDAAGDRALHVCARTDAGALVVRLLQLGADPDARNLAGNSFQDYHFSFDDALLSSSGRRQRHRVVVWMDQHDVRLVAGAERYR